jgi:hypothetical protein
MVAVVYAGMVRYRRLIGLDGAGTLQRLRTLRREMIDPTISEHGGRIVQDWRRFSTHRSPCPGRFVAGRMSLAERETWRYSCWTCNLILP